MKIKNIIRHSSYKWGLVFTSCHGDLNVIQPSQFTSLSMWTEES